jgi:carboxymethylenebutenolidase
MSRNLSVRALARRGRPAALASIGLFLVLGGLVRGAEPPPAAPPSAVAPALAGEVVESRGSFESQGKTIAIERFEPKGPGKYPAVLVVHGAGGMTIGGPLFREASRRLARQGYVAHVVHYFDLTGTRIADMSTMKEHFPAWMRVVADGITNVAKQPNVDGRRVGLLGFSLGSYLSLSLSVYDARVLAIVEYFGGLPEPLRKEVKSLPPTLILHGDADAVVPVAEAKALETLFKEKKVAHEVRIYPGQGHGFHGDPHEDALRRCLAFFDAHVKAADSSRPRATSAVPRPEAIPSLVGGE